LAKDRDQVSAALDFDIEARADLDAGVAIVDLMVKTNLASSKGEARRTLSQGGFYLNNQAVTEPDLVVRPDHLGTESFIFLRKGKKTYHLVRIV